MSTLHSLFGTTVAIPAADLRLRAKLPVTSGKAELELLLGPPPADDEVDAQEPSYVSSLTDEAGRTVLQIYRRKEGYLLRFPGLADFLVQQERIVCSPLPAADPAMLEIRLLGTVLTFWLESLGVPVLHASAVAWSAAGARRGSERGAVFLSSSRGGKTSLAAELMHRGAALLADDTVALDVGGPDAEIPDAETPDAEVRGVLLRPAYPMMRMWPDLARRWVDDPERWPRVCDAVDKRWLTVGEEGLGRFHRRRTPAAAIYLPERLDDLREVEIAAVAPAEALAELLRHSFLHRMPASMGWEEQRLETLARVVESVPMRRLRYPSGWQHLPAVAAKLERDLDAI